MVRALGATSLGSGAAEVTGGKLELGDGLRFGNSFTVDANGLLSGASGTVLSGSLAGTGTVAGLLRLGPGAMLSPGDGVGTLHVAGDLTLDAGSTLVFDLGATGNDSLAINPGASLTSNGATMRLAFGDGLGPLGNDPFWNTAQSWSVAAGPSARAISGSWLIDNSAWAPQGVFQTWYAADGLMLGWYPAVPEPETYAYVALAATSGLALRRRRNRDSDPVLPQFVRPQTTGASCGFACDGEDGGPPRPRPS